MRPPSGGVVVEKAVRVKVSGFIGWELPCPVATEGEVVGGGGPTVVVVRPAAEARRWGSTVGQTGLWTPGGRFGRWRG